MDTFFNVEKLVNTMISESYTAIRAVEAASAEIAESVDMISRAIANGGRLIYVGAGTSGRLGVLDASECPPTFGASPDTVIGIIAGGRECMFRASENAEDISSAGAVDIENVSCSEKDVVVGISAAGGAKYVLSALGKAKELGAATIGVSCNRGVPLERSCDVFVCTDTGPEVITGSTRLNAGTAQKIILNIFTTCAFIKNEYVCENVMINLKDSNEKLKGRQAKIVSELCKVDTDTAKALLEDNECNIKKAIQAYKEEK